MSVEGRAAVDLEAATSARSNSDTDNIRSSQLELQEVPDSTEVEGHEPGKKDGKEGWWEQHKKCFILILLYLYYIGACIWDYQSGRNHRHHETERHYSAWTLHVFFGCMSLYLICSFYNKNHCADLDAGGRNKDGALRRPDLALKIAIETAPSNVQFVLYGIFIAAWMVWVMVECGDVGEKWQCFLGLWVFVGCAVAISWHPRQIKWRPVIWGLFLQWIFGEIVLKSTWGFEAFDWLSNQVTRYLSYSDVGAEFVFGQEFTFAFRVLPTITWFSAGVYLMYHLGIIQFFINGITYGMQATLGTSASESLSAAGNIFVGQTEAPLLVRPYLNRMTASEVNAVMTGGFATIAGGVLGLFISFGIDAHHLLAASFMSAPAALAVAKIVLPELEDSETAAGKKVKITPEMLQTRGILDSITKGTLISITLVANIAALLITFLGLIDFADNIIGFLGERIGFVEGSRLGFTKICGYLFYPVSWLMGIPAHDCLIMGELLGIKVFVNELVAYTEMGCYFQNNELGSRAAFMGTYALCGFANFGSIGVQIGGLSPLAPNQRGTLLRVALRAMIAGNIACFMTACIAGILIDTDEVQGTLACD